MHIAFWATALKREECLGEEDEKMGTKDPTAAQLHRHLQESTAGGHDVEGQLFPLPTGRVGNLIIGFPSNQSFFVIESLI